MAVNGKITNNNSKAAKTGQTGFIAGIKGEFKRITWAPKSDVKKALGAVALCCGFYVLLVSLCDAGFTQVFRMIFGQ